MKKFILAAGFFLFSISVQAENTPTLIKTSIDRIYIPEGFDDNDNVQIVGEGIFANSCYRPAPSTAVVDSQKNEITLDSKAYLYNGYCLMVLLPFEISFQFGPLKAGNYSIKRTDGSILGTLHVRPSTTPDADYFEYAPITQAFFHNERNSSTVFLTGEFPLSCMKIKEVRSQIQADAIVIQPIAEIDLSKVCIPGTFSFNSQTTLGPIKAGKYLLHIRSMNGKSVNNLVQVK